MRRITTFRSTTDRKHDGGPIILQYYNYILGAHSDVVVKALRYKPAGRWFDSQ
jgi:hypothetical protein